jgi:integrase
MGLAVLGATPFVVCGDGGRVPLSPLTHSFAVCAQIRFPSFGECEFRRVPASLATPLLFPAPEGGPLNLNNFRRREWGPAVEASGIARPARIYDLRSTFASNALAAGVTVFELAKVMGTSVATVERHYGTLIGGAHAGIAGRLDALEAELSTVRGS